MLVNLLKCLLKAWNLAKGLKRCLQHSSDQIFIAAKVSKILMLNLSFSSGQSNPAWCLPHMTPLPPLDEPKSIEISFGSLIVTIFELLKREDKYAPCNNNHYMMKQGIFEMIPVLNKVIPWRSVSFYIYCCFISKTLKCFLQDSNLADSWGRCPQVDWQHSSAQISVARKISISRMAKIWPFLLANINQMHSPNTLILGQFGAC